MIDALLIYPKLGSMDSMVTDLPLSIMYAAIDSIKRGHNIKILDLRLDWVNWCSILKKNLDEGVLFVGISVMTGEPLRYAREIAYFIRQHSPKTKIVWGGSHVTVVPEVIKEPYLDFIVRGYGSRALADLIDYIKTGRPILSDILGISYKQKHYVTHNPRSTSHENINYHDIPYDKVDVLHPRYGRSYAGLRMFPIFTAIGCPYECAFCIHPQAYKVIDGPKWLPYLPKDVVGHIELLITKFNAKHFCFFDDTTFTDLKRMQELFKLILLRKIEITIEFRGARINDIDRMDDDFLSLIQQAGGQTLLIGVESANNKLLDRMKKGITKEQILRVNRKLARHPSLKPMYNFMYGHPGETYETLLETKNVILQLLKENPGIYINVGADWKPIPGTKAVDIAEKEYGYMLPKTMDEWIEVDTFDATHKIEYPWYNRRINNLIKSLQIASFVLGDKLEKESSANKSLFFLLLRFSANLYRPIAIFRLKNNIFCFPIEYAIWKRLLRMFFKNDANLSVK